MIAKEILETYDKIVIIKVCSEDYIMFRLFEKDFLLICPPKNDISSAATIWLYNDEGLDFPHIQLGNFKTSEGTILPPGQYRYVCLYEQESVVQSLLSFEEKIRDSVNRLIELLTMTKVEQENELQKEFLYYWESFTEGQCSDVYLKQDSKFCKLQKFTSGKITRYIEPDIRLIDLDSRNEKGERKWQQHLENEVFFIPITDSREILPPYHDYSWTIENIKEIIYGKQINHISTDTYLQLKQEIVSTRNVILVFEMNVVNTKVCFAVMVKCKNKSGRTLFEKINEDGTGISLIAVKRKDYLYLNEIIGNDRILYGKKVLLVGCGSLGSYVAPELVKNGAADIVLYDADKLYDENRMRWVFGGLGINLNKADILGIFLEMIHPQVHTEIHKNNLDKKALKSELQSAELIIFTIGNSDEQLKFNRILSELHCKIPVFFVWLEAGGKYSHILTVNYEKQGCFECLFTNTDGQLVNNRAMLNTEEQVESSLLRNGCGGTRAAYGTSVLLRTVAVLLNIMQKFFEGEIKNNTLIDILPDKVSYPAHIIPMEKCNCCGNRKKLQMCETETSK